MLRSSLVVSVLLLGGPHLFGCTPAPAGSTSATSATTGGATTGTDGGTSTSATDTGTTGGETTTDDLDACSGAGGTGTGEVYHTEAWVRELHEPAQDPAWYVPYTTCDVTKITGIERASDGSIYVLGYTLVIKDCPNDEPCDKLKVGWLRRLDADYNELWSRAYDRDDYNLRALKVADDGGVYVAGSSISGDAYAPWLTRIDAEGGATWEVALDESGWVNGLDVGPSGELAVVGEVIVDASNDLWVARLEPTGALLWSKALGGDLPQSGVAVAVDDAGRIWAAGGAGRTDSELRWEFSNPQMLLYWLDEPRVTLLDADGEVLWTREWPLESYYGDGALALDLLPGGDAIVGGGIDDLGWLVRLDVSGASVWELSLEFGGEYQTGSMVTDLEVDASGDIHLVHLAYHGYGGAYVAVSSDGEVLVERPDAWLLDAPLDVLALTSDETPLLTGTDRRGIYFYE